VGFINDRIEFVALERLLQIALGIGYLWKKVSSGAEHRILDFRGDGQEGRLRWTSTS